MRSNNGRLRVAAFMATGEMGVKLGGRKLAGKPLKNSTYNLRRRRDAQLFSRCSRHTRECPIDSGNRAERTQFSDTDTQNLATALLPTQYSRHWKAHPGVLIPPLQPFRRVGQTILSA